MPCNRLLHIRPRTVAALSLAVIGWAGACDADRRVTQPQVTQPEESVSLVVSDPAAGVVLPSGDFEVPLPSLAGRSGAPVNVAFISLPPGTVPAGTHATLRNRPMGITVTVQMVAGGFDPVGIPAEENDTVEIEVHRAGDLAPLLFAHTVPRRRPPKIVRISPPPGKRDVALNSSIVVVFSEPMDARTITDQSVQLLRGTTPVAGRIELGRNHMTASFVPNELLAATTEYQLVVSRDVRDLDGDALEEVVASEFTTGEGTPAGDALGTLHLKTTTTGVDLPDDHVVRLHGASRDTFFIVGVNATPEIRLPLGDYTVALEASRVNGGQLADNCETVGPSSHNVTVLSGGSAATELVVVCAPAPVLAFVKTSIGEVSEAAGQTYTAGEIYTIKTNGTAGTGLGVYTTEPPAWSPDGSRLAFSSGGDIYVINPDGSGHARLTNGPSVASFRSWSPDGSKIAFTSARNGSLELYVMNADGTNPTRLTTPDSVVEPAWSRDWRKIVFARSGDIYVMNADGTSVTRLTSLGSSGQPAWSPDGTRVAFVRFTTMFIEGGYGGYRGNVDDSDLYVMNADGSGVTRVASGSNEGFGIFGGDLVAATYTAPAWSADGRWLAFTHTACDNGFYGCFLHTVELLEVEGSRMRTLAEGSRPAWRP
jgi:TolB protein